MDNWLVVEFIIDRRELAIDCGKDKKIERYEISQMLRNEIETDP